MRAERDPLSLELDTGFLPFDLTWDPNFRPDELQEVVRLEGIDRRFRLIDADGKSATIKAPGSIQPVNENGHLVIRVALPAHESRDVAAITGQVVDSEARPIPGVRVAVANQQDLLRREQTCITIQRRMPGAAIACAKSRAGRSMAHRCV